MSKQTNDEQWVFIVVSSRRVHFQVYDDDAIKEERPRKPRWVRVLVRLFAVGKKVYAFTL